MKRIPIKACKDIAEKYKQDQVILITWDATENKTHIVTYGKTLKDCEQAAIGGNALKKVLGWPEEMCNAMPPRVKKKVTNA